MIDILSSSTGGVDSNTHLFVKEDAGAVAVGEPVDGHEREQLFQRWILQAQDVFLAQPAHQH